MAILFVSHDLAVIAELCDRVAIMRAGEVIEQGRTGDVIAAPRHEYTRELLAAVPRLDA
jgi:ABC-type dipeptide/oligopeptide/nickel transport system ATPase component